MDFFCTYLVGRTLNEKTSVQIHTAIPSTIPEVMVAKPLPSRRTSSGSSCKKVERKEGGFACVERCIFFSNIYSFTFYT